MSEHVEKEMKRFRKNILPQMQYIGNLKRKIEDIKDDDMFKNSHIISLNETHLGHSDTLTPDIMGIS